MNKRFKNVISLLSRFLIAGLIIYFLTRGKKMLIVQTMKSMDPIWFTLAFFCFVTSFIICVVRWHSLLKIQKISLSFFDTFVLAMRGMFFSLVIPGAVGGDLAKAAFISAKIGVGAKTKAVFSILIDRIIGMIGLFLLAGVLGVISYGQIAKFADSAKILLLILIAGSVSGFLGVAFLFFHREFEKIPPVKLLLHFADRYSNGMPGHLMDALDVYRKSYTKLTLWILISAIFVHLLQGISLYCVVRGTEIFDQKINYVVLSASMGNAVGAIPLTPSGLGTRDVVISSLLSASGINKEKALSIAITNTVIIIIFNLTGGIFFIFGGRKK